MEIEKSESFWFALSVSDIERSSLSWKETVRVRSLSCSLKFSPASLGHPGPAEATDAEVLVG
jgi:hypothetical protein